jgi:hypothetical protein
VPPECWIEEPAIRRWGETIGMDNAFLLRDSMCLQRRSHFIDERGEEKVIEWIELRTDAETVSSLWR